MRGIIFIFVVLFLGCEYNYQSYPEIKGEDPNYYEDHGVPQQGQQRCYFNKAEIYLENRWIELDNCTLQGKLCYYDPDYYIQYGSTQGRAYCK